MKRPTSIISLILGFLLLIGAGYFFYVLWSTGAPWTTLPEVWELGQLPLLKILGPAVLAFSFGFAVYQKTALTTWGRLVWVLALLEILGVVGYVMSTALVVNR